MLLTPAAVTLELCVVLLSCCDAQALMKMGGTPSSNPYDAPPVLPGDPVPAADVMLEWIVQHGGKVNVAVRSIPGQGRAIFAAHYIKQGDMLAVIPRKLCFVTDQDHYNSSAQLWAEMQTPGSPYAPYLQALPESSEAYSGYAFPETYLPLIQNKPMEDSMQDYKRYLHHVWQTYFESQADFAQLQYTMGLIESRSFDFHHNGELMVPLLDMANHHHGCPHRYTGPVLEPCSAGSSEECIIWRAGADVAAGAEVCNSYGTMLQDKALLQYGFLQDGPMTKELSGIDRHDFDRHKPWTVFSDTKAPKFIGTHLQVEAEVARLQQLLGALNSFDRLQLPTITADPLGDPEGKLLQKLIRWRQQRQKAVAAEIQRLLGRLQLLNQLQWNSRHELQQGLPNAAAFARLADWMRQAGAEVNVAVDVIQSPSISVSAATEHCVNSSNNSRRRSSSKSRWKRRRQYNAACAGKGCASCTFSSSSSITAVPSVHRMVVASKAVREGDPLAVVPYSMAYQIQHGSKGRQFSTAQAALWVMLDMHEATNSNEVGSHLASKARGRFGRTSSNRSSTRTDCSVTLSTGAPVCESTDMQQPRRHRCSSSNDQGHNSSSRQAEFWQSFFATLPLLGGVHNMYTLPEEYFPLIQNDKLEAYIRKAQDDLVDAWHANEAEISSEHNSLLLEHFRHTMALVSSQVICLDSQILMVPLLHAARHASTCPHQVSMQTCPAQISTKQCSGSRISSSSRVVSSSSRISSSVSNHSLVSDSDSHTLAAAKMWPQTDKMQGMCIWWTAGADLQAGDEICSSYRGHLVPDKALLQYGMLLPPAAAAQVAIGSQLLFAMDQKDANPEDPLGCDQSQTGDAATAGLPMPFTGTLKQAQTELNRLEALHAKLMGPEAVAAAANVTQAAWDFEGKLLWKLQQLRQHRIAAIEAAMKPLRHILEPPW